MKSKHIVSTAACAALFLFQTGSWAQLGSSQTGSGSSRPGSFRTDTGDVQSGQIDKGSTSAAGTQSKSSSTAATSTGMKVTSADREFIKKAAQGGMAEVEMGRLATQKGTTEAVRQYGQRMVDDHSKVNDRLKAIAAQRGITLPTTLDSKHRAAVQRLSSFSGERFDQAYVKEMHKDHMEDVSEFEKISSNASSDLKPFADETLPTLREHLAVAQELSATIGGLTSSSSSPGQHDMDTSSSRKPKSKTSDSQPGTTSGTTGTQPDTDTSTRTPK